MFAPGFVWLVTDDSKASRYSGETQQRRLHIYSTYGAGSPLSGAHFRKQLDKRTGISFDDQGKAKVTAQRIAETATLDVTPILCVSTWQHSYIHDHGVGGKEAFLEKWWNQINWTRAASRVEINNPNKSRLSRIANTSNASAAPRKN
jgi:Fe-Mn family superoxide dismutase